MVPAQRMKRKCCQLTTLSGIELEQLASEARGLGARGCSWEWATWRHGLQGEREWESWTTVVDTLGSGVC